MNPAREDLKCAYFKIVHEKARKWLTLIWENLFVSFQLKNLITFSN